MDEYDDLKIHLPEKDLEKLLEAEFKQISPKNLGVARQIVMALRISGVCKNLAILLENMIDSHARTSTELSICRRAFSETDDEAYARYMENRLRRIKQRNAVSIKSMVN